MVESYFCTKMSLKLSAARYFALHDSLLLTIVHKRYVNVGLKRIQL